MQLKSHFKWEMNPHIPMLIDLFAKIVHQKMTKAAENVRTFYCIIGFYYIFRNELHYWVLQAPLFLLRHTHTHTNTHTHTHTYSTQKWRQ